MIENGGDKHEYLRTHPLRGGGQQLCPYISRCTLRIDEKSNDLRTGNQLTQHLQALGLELGRKQGDTGDIAAWPVEARDQAALYRIATADKDDRDRGRRPDLPQFFGPRLA